MEYKWKRVFAWKGTPLVALILTMSGTMAVFDLFQANPWFWVPQLVAAPFCCFVYVNPTNRLSK